MVENSNISTDTGVYMYRSGGRYMYGAGTTNDNLMRVFVVSINLYNHAKHDPVKILDRLEQSICIS